MAIGSNATNPSNVKACECCGAPYNKGKNTSVKRWAISRYCSRSCASRDNPTLQRHGRSHTPEHNAWTGMKQRCSNPKNKRYPVYGGRGITVCERWRESFEAFYADMGPRTSPKHSIDRINVNGNYEPGNVRWATNVEQANNMSKNRSICVDGRLVSMADAERLTGVSQKLIASRLNRNWPVNDLLLPAFDKLRHRRK